MRPLENAFSNSARPRSKPSSVSSRSPSPGLRGNGAGTAGGTTGMTYFLTEENDFGVHSMSESHPSLSLAHDIEDGEEHATGKRMGDSQANTSFGVKTDKTIDQAVVSAVPGHVVDTPDIGSNLSSTFSTPSSPRQTLSSSAISDESE